MSERRGLRTRVNVHPEKDGQPWGWVEDSLGREVYGLRWSGQRMREIVEAGLRAEAKEWDASGEPEPGGLDVAWALVSKSLPEGWVLDLFDYGPPNPYNPGPGEPYHTPRYQASANLGIRSGPPKVYGRSDESPAAALLDLAARLATTPERPAKEGAAGG